MKASTQSHGRTKKSSRKGVNEEHVTFNCMSFFSHFLGHGVGSKTMPAKRKASSAVAAAAPKKAKSVGRPSKQCSAFQRVVVGKDVPPLSERRLKQYSVAKAGKFPLTVGITGARADDTLRGVEDASSGDVANVVLRIESGVVSAPSIIRRSVEAEVGRDVLIDAVSKHFRISKAAAELRYENFPTIEAPNHQPLGSGCSHGIEEDCQCPPAATFVIVSQGVWQSFAEQHGNGAEMQKLGF